MRSGPTSGQLLRLSRAARAAARRLRFNAALRRFVRLLPIPLGYALLARAAMRWLEPGPDATRLLWGGFFLACLAVLGGVAACWLARRAPHAGALALDRHHQSADRITNALAILWATIIWRWHTRANWLEVGRRTDVIIKE